MRVTVFIVKILFLSFFFIVSSLNLPLGVDGNFDEVWGEYQEWGSNVAIELGTVTGYVVNVEWLPDLDGERSAENVNVDNSGGPRFSAVRK